jgi:hypothetical protein
MLHHVIVRGIEKRVIVDEKQAWWKPWQNWIGTNGVVIALS